MRITAAMAALLAKYMQVESMVRVLQLVSVLVEVRASDKVACSIGVPGQLVSELGMWQQKHFLRFVQVLSAARAAAKC